MAAEVNGEAWPKPGFYFTATLIDGAPPVSFQEVTGLESEPHPIEYRHANTPVFQPIKMPALGSVGNVTLRKGVFANDTTFWNWYNAIKLNTSVRHTVIITLLNDAGTRTMTWTLNNAWPTRVTGTDLESEGNEVAVESVEVAYETLIVTAP